jgi:surfactin synthase thioesterase subunit
MAKAPWLRDILAAATVTQPSSNVRRLPLDAMANSARSATPRVVEAQGTVERLKAAFKNDVEEAETYLATLKTEYEAKITAAEIELDKLQTERRRAQWMFTREAIESGVFEGVKDINELARSTEFEK